MRRTDAEAEVPVLILTHWKKQTLGKIEGKGEEGGRG